MGRYVLALLVLIFASGARAEPRPYLAPARLVFHKLQTVADLEPLNPNVHYVAGYEMEASGTSAFIGLSDVQLSGTPDHLRAEAVSDSGAVAFFDLNADGAGGYQPSDLDIVPLLDAGGHRHPTKQQGDSEDLAIDPVTGDRFVSFEGYHRIERFRAPKTYRAPGEILPFSGLRAFPSNEGMEALTWVRDAHGVGALLVGVESGGYFHCRLAPDWRCDEIEGPQVPGFFYKITSFAVLDASDPRHDQDILALYRYYDPVFGPRNVLWRLRWDGVRLRFAEALIKVKPPLPVDNYEGVAAVKITGGYRLFLIADTLRDSDLPHLLVYDWMTK